MGRFRVSMISPLEAGEAFRRLVDLDAHTAVIPFTTLIHDGPLQAGSRFTGRTALGPLKVDDSMLVREYAAPDRVVFTKTGRWVTGEIVLTVASLAEGSRILWEQDIAIPWLPRALDPVVTQIARRAYATGLRRLLARA